MQPGPLPWLAEWANNAAGQSVADCEPGPRAPTGELFVTLMSGGVKPEAERAPGLFATPELAVHFWRASFWDYVEGYAGDKTLYWRVAPQLIEEEYTWAAGSKHAVTEKFYTIRARLLVSDKPALERAA